MSTWKDGRITRGEFYSWLEMRNIPKENVLKKKDQQKTNLEEMAKERIAAAEARKAGFDKKEDFIFLSSLMKRNYYASKIGKKLKDEFSFKEKAAKVRIIKLFVKDYKIENNQRKNLNKDELEKEYAVKMEAAKKLLAELDKGASFKDIASKHSDDYTKSNGGDIGWVTSGMRSDEFTKAAFAVKEGEYTKKPVRMENSVYLIAVDEYKDLTEKNLDSVIKEESQRNMIKNKLLMKSVKDRQESMIKAKDVEYHPELATSGNPDSIIYRVGEVKYTTSEFNKLLSYIANKRREMGMKTPEFNEAMKKGMINSWFQEELMAREAVKKGLDKDENFKRDLNMFMDANLSRFYINEAIAVKKDVTPAEVQQDYDRNRDRVYSRQDPTAPGKKRIIPFNEVRESIEARLVNQKRAEAKNKWESDLMKKLDYKVNESMLSGD
jgi:peptidyl-prolyl cis-trans isomerase C